jgi:hypothetical protein
MEELLLDPFFALDELDVVDQQHIDIAVAALEGDLAVAAQRVDEVVGELFGRDILDPHAGKQPLRVVAGGVQKVRLAESGFAPNEQRVVRAGRCFSNRQGGRVSEPIRGADDERVKYVAAVQARPSGSGWIVVARPFSEVGRPALVGAGESFTIFVDFVGVDAEIVGLGDPDVVGFVGARGSDAHPEFNLTSESVAQRFSDLRPQMTFDLILHEAARNRQQRKSLNHGERPNQV